MSDIKGPKGSIGILTGGGDVPGLNPAIRAVTIRALHEGYEVIGIRRGWAGLVELERDSKTDHSEHYLKLTEEIVNRAGRTGGTFLHTSRTRPSSVPDVTVPQHLRDTYKEKANDLTPEVLKNLEYLGIEEGRVQFSWVSAAEGVKFSQVITEVTNDIRKLGPAKRLVKKSEELGVFQILEPLNP